MKRRVESFYLTTRDGQHKRTHLGAIVSDSGYLVQKNGTPFFLSSLASENGVEMAELKAICRLEQCSDDALACVVQLGEFETYKVQTQSEVRQERENKIKVERKAKIDFVKGHGFSVKREDIYVDGNTQADFDLETDDDVVSRLVVRDRDGEMVKDLDFLLSNGIDAVLKAVIKEIEAEKTDDGVIVGDTEKTAKAEREAIDMFFRKSHSTRDGSLEATLVAEGDSVKRLCFGSGFTVFGTGVEFYITAEAVWRVINNGMDGDDWSLNNFFRTSGAGAIAERYRLKDAEKQGIVELMLKHMCAA